MKNIILVSQYFWPEIFQINYVAENLVKNNINLHVFTGLPNYPNGKIYKKYKKINSLQFQKYKNIKIYRCPIYPRKNASSLNLILNYLSFVYYGVKFFSKINFKYKINYIFTYSTSPITANIPAIFLKKKFNSKLAIWLQDIWPESIKSTGHINNKIIIYLIGCLTKLILNYADIIFVPSKRFIKNTREKTSNKKIVYLPNAAFNTSNKKIKIKTKLFTILKNKKCFIYSGNIGKAQNIETIIRAANILRDEKKCCFIIIGNGSEKIKIKKLIKFYKLNNILLYGKKSFNEVNEISKYCRGLLLPLKNDDLFNLYIPNKFQNYLMLKKPIIASLNGAVKDIITKNKIGFVSRPNDEKKLAFNIKKIIHMKNKELKIIKKNCDKILKKDFSSKIQIKKLINYLK